MLANVVEIDLAMMKSALCDEAGMAIFFDFRAAFPSVAHGFLREALAAIGLPPWVLSFVDVLYKQNKCTLVAGGRQHLGFELLAGIRQGCPLSPLLFSAAVDILLRRIARLVPAATIRAYADDVAVVLPAGADSLAVVVQIFEKFA